MQPDDGPQRQLDFQRGEQLRLLRDAQLPAVKDPTGKGISPIMLKSVLRAVDDFARGKSCTAAVDSIADSACVSRRHCMRALEALTQLGLLCHDEQSRWGRRGSSTISRRIVWSELALLCDRGLLQPARQTPLERPNRVPQGHYDPPNQSALGADQSAPGADQSAPRGTQYDKKRPRNGLEAPSFVVVGAKNFSTDEQAATLAKATELGAAAGVHSERDRLLVLKIAVLWQLGQLSEDMVKQVLESFARKRDAGDPVRNGQAWLWRGLWNQCRQHGLRLEKLLAQTELTPTLLAWQPVPSSATTLVLVRAEKQAAARRTDERAELLERLYGAELEGLGTSELEDLASEARIDRNIFRQLKRDGLLRITLLEALATRMEVR